MRQNNGQYPSFCQSSRKLCNLRTRPMSPLAFYCQSLCPQNAYFYGKLIQMHGYVINWVKGYPGTAGSLEVCEYRTYCTNPDTHIYFLPFIMIYIYFVYYSNNNGLLYYSIWILYLYCTFSLHIKQILVTMFGHANQYS